MRRILLTLVWAVAATVVIFLITLPISLQAHLIAGSIVLGAMILLKITRPEGVWRLVALALGTAIVLRYVYWRTSSTLPPASELENFIPGVLLYLAEMYSVAMLALSLFVVAFPLPPRRSPQLPEDRLPTVDVFVPSYNEDARLLATTLAAAKGMDYPADRFTVWLLDDGGTDQKCESDDAATAVTAQKRRRELQRLCADLDVNYLTRARNVHAKAGNLNNGLEHSNGELVAVFDADHAPARDFLKETVGFFEGDPKLFLVQTPHFFINPDPLERNLGTFERMPSENEMFYGIIQRGLDKWNASFFCGSAAVLRRRALEATKGFSGISITEDCETALELHARGWSSIYVDKPLIAGLQPDTFASFVGQRTRWAQGMMQILRFRFPPLKRGLSLAQRLCYMSSTMFWLFPISRIIFLISPLFYLFFGLEIFNASGAEFLAYTSTYMIVNLMMQNYIYGRYRWPWISELYELLQSVYLFPALLSVIANPKQPTFKVTAKGEAVAESRISEIGMPFFIIFGVLVASLGVAAWRVVYEPYRADLTLVVAGWSVLNLVMVGCALGVVSERGNPRQSHRVQVARRCELIFGDEREPATIENVSVGGASIRPAGNLVDKLRVGSLTSITFKPYADIPPAELPLVIRRIDIQADGVHLGCQFLTREAIHHRLIADLLFANSKQWEEFQKSRRVNIGVLRGTVMFLAMSIYQTGRALGYLLGFQKRPAPAYEGHAAEVER
jgi:cellulose synthase (UDP-forming)